MNPQLAIDITKIVLAVGGAVWVYFRFVRERSHARRVSFAIDCNFYGPQQGLYVTEFVMRIMNQGLVVHRFSQLHLRVRGIEKGAALQPWPGQPSRLSFPQLLISEEDVLFSQKYGHVFVEPGIEQTITFVTSVPQTTSLILARAEFRYSDTRTHSTERVFVPSPSGAAGEFQ